jgi:hypothetical protein
MHHGHFDASCSGSLESGGVELVNIEQMLFSAKLSKPPLDKLSSCQVSCTVSISTRPPGIRCVKLHLPFTSPIQWFIYQGTFRRAFLSARPLHTISGSTPPPHTKKRRTPFPLHKPHPTHNTPSHLQITSPSPLRLLLKQQMCNPPRITALPPKQLRTRQIENLPPIPPRHNILLAVRLHKMRPDLRLVREHRGEPVFAGLRVVVAVDPPLLLQGEGGLEEVEEVRGGHCSCVV